MAICIIILQFKKKMVAFLSITFLFQKSGFSSNDKDFFWRCFRRSVDKYCTKCSDCAQNECWVFSEDGVNNVWKRNEKLNSKIHIKWRDTQAKGSSQRNNARTISQRDASRWKF